MQQKREETHPCSPSPSSSASLCSQFENLVQSYQRSKASLTQNDLIAYESRFVRLLSQLLQPSDRTEFTLPSCKEGTPSSENSVASCEERIKFCQETISSSPPFPGDPISVSSVQPCCSTTHSSAPIFDTKNSSRAVETSAREGPSYPSLSSWLSIIGVSDADVSRIQSAIPNLPTLIETENRKLVDLCDRLRLSIRTRTRLIRSTDCVRRYIRATEHRSGKSRKAAGSILREAGLEEVSGEEEDCVDEQLSWSTGEITAKRRGSTDECAHHRRGKTEEPTRKRRESTDESASFHRRREKTDDPIYKRRGSTTQDSLSIVASPTTAKTTSAVVSPRALSFLTRCVSPPREAAQDEEEKSDDVAVRKAKEDAELGERKKDLLSRRGTSSSYSLLASQQMNSSFSSNDASSSSASAATTPGWGRSPSSGLPCGGLTISTSGSGPGRQPTRTLCPPSPIAIQPSPSPASGARRPVHSTSMQFGGNRSPQQARFLHAIPHVWVRRNTFRFSDQLCALCRRQLGFGFITTWEKCKSCKLKVHTHCKNRMGDTCGLTVEHLRAIFDDVVQQGNQDAWCGPQSAHVIHNSRSLNEPTFQYPESTAFIDSSSSTNSSAPSTPAFVTGGGQVHSPFMPVVRSAAVTDRGRFSFTFTDCLPEVPDIVLPDSCEERPGPSSLASASTGYDSSAEDVNGSRGGTQTELFPLDAFNPTTIGSLPNSSLIGSQDSEKTMRMRLEEGSEGTVIIDSQDSCGEGSGTTELSPGGLTDIGHTWDRTKWNMSTIRGASAQGGWTEVTIPLNKIDFPPKNLIGRGRFGVVLRGYHFGDVAVKFMNMDHVEEEEKVEEFKAEVACFKNTRHDNIVLCLGYCFDHHNLGIVMGLCKGRTLHSLLHGAMSKSVDFATAVNYATQICQGVSYLHQKRIIHKDLRSKNIFIEAKSKVVITDLGLFSMKRLKYPIRNYSMVVPSFWLSYLSPELIRELSGDFRELPFSEFSDVFAFGTIWYELLTSNMPLAKMHPSEIIYRVGRGICAPLQNITCIREVKIGINTNDEWKILCKKGGIREMIDGRSDDNVLRRIVTRLVREERAELQWNRAVEARPYLERLLQLAIERGPDEEYTKEMMEWWLMEQGLVEKVYEVLVPRMRSLKNNNLSASYTTIWRLPPRRLQMYIQNKRVFWKRYDIGVLEIDGNPFPPVVPNAQSNSNSLLNVLLRNALEAKLHESEDENRRSHVMNESSQEL